MENTATQEAIALRDELINLVERNDHDRYHPGVAAVISDVLNGNPSVMRKLLNALVPPTTYRHRGCVVIRERYMAPSELGYGYWAEYFLAQQEVTLGQITGLIIDKTGGALVIKGERVPRIKFEGPAIVPAIERLKCASTLLVDLTEFKVAPVDLIGCRAVLGDRKGKGWNISINSPIVAR